MRRMNSALSRRRFVWSAAAACLVAGVASPRHVLAQGKRRLRYISFAGKNSIWSQPYGELARLVDEKSGGELQIDWVGGPEVVGAMQAGEAISKGVFDIAHSATSYYAEAVPEAIALSAGRMSQDSLYDSGVVAAMDEIHQKKLNVIFLSVATSGIGFIFLCREAPKDLSYFKGRKMRSIPLIEPVLTALEAAPVTIGPSEVYTALERGVVDGIAWPEVTIKEFGFHNRAKFLMRPAFYGSRTPHLMNRQAFEGLPQPLQVVLRDAAREAGRIADKVYRDTAAAELKAMKEEAGLTEVPLPEADAKSFLALTEEKLWEKVARVAPDSAPRLKELFAKAEALG